MSSPTRPLPADAPLPQRRWPGALPLRRGPWVLHLHGGAFVGGSPDTGAAVAGLLAECAGLVVSLDYPLAPANPFPHAAEAAHAALLALDRERRAQAPAAPLWVAGEEAGGNLAAALSLMSRDRAAPLLAGQILLSPMLDACLGTPSQRAAGEGPLGCRCADGWRAYLARRGDALHPYAAPAESLRLAGLPPSLLVTAQDDPQRDETLAFERRLRAAGVASRAVVLPQPTGWPCSFAQAQAGPWAVPLRETLRHFIQRNHHHTDREPA